MNKEQARQYKQSLLSSVRKQQSTCEGLRKNIKRLQDELTLELAVLEDVYRELDKLDTVLE